MDGFNDRDGDGLNFGQDCDDTDPAVTTKLKFYPDIDGDGFGDLAGQPSSWCDGDQPDGYVLDNSDCDDASSAIHITATEICDNINADEDCNGFADDLDNEAQGKGDYYIDADGDGYGDENAPAESFCDPPSTHVTDGSDCDDGAETVNPGAVEICDALDVDEDCNGLADDADQDGIDVLPMWYLDDDDDGYGDVDDTSPLMQCEGPSGRVEDNTDCDDGSADVHPGRVEVCDIDNVDEDCSGAADNADPNATGVTSFYPDLDGDGYGNAAADPKDVVDQCDGESGLVEDDTDCDDGSASIHPAAVEVCDDGDVDENCNSLSEDEDPTLDLSTRTDWFLDSDGDLYGDAGNVSTDCEAPFGHVADNTDCDDGEFDVNPGIVDRPGDGDMNCDGADYICGESRVRVYLDGNDPDADYGSIQAAVDAVENTGVSPTLCDGDIIEVTPGTYSENLQILDVSPRIVGVAGPGLTIIDGGDNGRVVNMERTSATLESFTITGGDTASEVLQEGAGVRVFYGTDVVLRDLIVEDNYASVAGGIDLNNPQDVQVLDSIIRDNYAEDGVAKNAGGVRVKAVGGAGGGTLLFDGVQIEDNIAGNQDGGLRIEVGSSLITVVIRDSTLVGNYAVNTGGLGIRVGHLVEVYDTDISQNHGAAKIGGAYVESATAHFEGVTFDENTTGATLSAFQAQNLTGDLTFVDCDFTDNEVTSSGYAVLINGSETYGAVMRDVRVIGNTGHSLAYFGGAVALEGYADIANVLVHGNSGFFGLALYEEQVIPGPADPALQSVVNSVFTSNDGDGLQVATSTTLGITLKNVISADNGGYGITNGAASAVISYTGVFGNALGGYSDSDQTGVAGNVAVDPVFVDLASGDVHLSVGSPLIDAGDPSLDDPDGSRSDLGYYGGPGAPQ